jgi:hypothetical protein
MIGKKDRKPALLSGPNDQNGNCSGEGMDVNDIRGLII